MVNVSLTVKEIVAIMQSTGRDFDDLYDKLLKALEDAIVAPKVNSEPKSGQIGSGLLYLHSIPQDRHSFLHAVKIIRNISGISLLKTKQFCDEVRGDYKYDFSGKTTYQNNGKSNTMEMTVDTGYEIASKLREIGCTAGYYPY